MENSLKKFWNDENGFIISAELITVATLLVLGLLVGLASLQESLLSEYQDLGFAFSSMNQSYFLHGFQGSRAGRCGITSRTFGSSFFDRNDRQGGVSIVCDNQDSFGEGERGFANFSGEQQRGDRGGLDSNRR